MPRGRGPRNLQSKIPYTTKHENHGQPCAKCDGSCRLPLRGSLSSEGTPIAHPLTPVSTPSSTDSSRSIPASLPGGENHMEYGAPISMEELEPYLTRGPGAFCAPPWHINLPRLMSDINILFRCFSTSSINVSEDSRILRRLLLDFYILGFTQQRPSQECWEALLQLSPEQSRPLRATLRDINTRKPYEETFLHPPKNKPNVMFGEECDVSGSESEDDDYDDVYTSDDSFIVHSSEQMESSSSSSSSESSEDETSESETELDSDDPSKSSTGQWSTSSDESSDDELMKDCKRKKVFTKYKTSTTKNKRKLRSLRSKIPPKKSKTSQ
ncbi:regulatory protein ICP22-like protein [Phocid alphaherpesvirus 1]|uniref:Transcriptional regulator ICP22 homolog n=1 Tax=Phocid alphaherpesvirus 1 TaxID=47418 RepID=A0A482F620_9ALPH|nr:regulatory protein ICP22-like protein [Phocid alphaherpesvirus 1]QBN85178.1 regulatory protein ICP22-like protein [Phocid alphaherpesvirus 1]UNP64292.1 regulatory protein ICP22-like protein [Phocid alphaherpesvirus 1]UNP64307.1 regulatory protein ICP22-like protein [Phocid alphaherpesvirus 1]